MPSLFTEPQVVYFNVPALLGGQSNRQAAKFALYTLLTSAVMIPAVKRHQVYCVIDEFQEIIGTNIGLILRQARSFDVGMILANQLLADLQQGATDLTKTVHGNTAFRWSFRTSDLDHQDQLMKASGEFIDILRSKTFGTQYDEEGSFSGFSESLAFSEERRPAFDRNRLLWASFVEDLSVAHFSKGKGFTQFFRPFPLRTMFHISEELYRERAGYEWPELPETMLDARSPFGAIAPPTNLSSPPSSQPSSDDSAGDS